MSLLALNFEGYETAIADLDLLRNEGAGSSLLRVLSIPRKSYFVDSRAADIQSGVQVTQHRNTSRLGVWSYQRTTVSEWLGQTIIASALLLESNLICGLERCKQ